MPRHTFSLSPMRVPVQRVALLAANLFFHRVRKARVPLVVATRHSGRNARRMWIPMLPPSVGLKRWSLSQSRTSSTETNLTNALAPKRGREQHDGCGDSNKNWWLTNRLLWFSRPTLQKRSSPTHKSTPSKGASPKRGPSSTITSSRRQLQHQPQSGKEENDELEQTDWAITRLLVPRKFQQQSNRLPTKNNDVNKQSGKRR